MEERNPYQVLIKKYKRRFKADAVGIDPLETLNLKTGEVRNAVQLVGNNKYYDNTDFIKFYDPHILTEMTSEAVGVFAYIASNLQFGGYVLFDYDDCINFTNYSSRQSVYRGLMKLKEMDVVRPKCRGEWWVNPNIIYRGQRTEI